MSSTNPNPLVSGKLGEEHDLLVEHREPPEWPSSPPPCPGNIALALKLCSGLASPGTSPVLIPQNRAGWSAQDCIEVDCVKESYIVKVPRNSSIDTVAACKAEMMRACWAEDNLLGPKVVADDDASGAFAMQFIKGQTLASTELAKQYIPQLMQLLHRCHDSPVMPWMHFWDPLNTVQKKLDLAETLSCMAPKDFQLVKQVLSWARNGLGKVSRLRVPCHNDYHGGNVMLDENEKLWAIDYEECNLGDPMWDLAYLTATLELDKHALIRGYGCEEKEEEKNRLGYYYILAIAYCGTWRATHIKDGSTWGELYRKTMALLRKTLSKDGITFGPQA